MARSPVTIGGATAAALQFTPAQAGVHALELRADVAGTTVVWRGELEVASALPVLVGCQLLISAVNFDIANVPSVPLHPSLASRR